MVAIIGGFKAEFSESGNFTICRGKAETLLAVVTDQQGSGCVLNAEGMRNKRERLIDSCFQ